ncbi:BREX system Lon protease-like protein BrxL, partial [Salmonella enterica]|uniref:BREX system Lon protease-like protein BrxL n=1 Tax=Salmonella enterica TaxID=28901 RepID=UPI00398C49C5
MSRGHAIVPGWPIPVIHAVLTTTFFVLVPEFHDDSKREVGKPSISNKIDQLRKMGINLNPRDVVAVTRTVSGLMKR